MEQELLRKLYKLEVDSWATCFFIIAQTIANFVLFYLILR